MDNTTLVIDWMINFTLFGLQETIIADSYYLTYLGAQVVKWFAKIYVVIRIMKSTNNIDIYIEDISIDGDLMINKCLVAGYRAGTLRYSDRSDHRTTHVLEAERYEEQARQAPNIATAMFLVHWIRWGGVPSGELTWQKFCRGCTG